MQKCENCNAQFSWKKIYKSFWWNYKPIKCGNCGTEHKITIPGRITFVSLTLLPMLIYGNFLSSFNNILITLGTALLIFFVGTLFVPFLVTYKSS
ncbi:TIGR04104 family putative zinc finger protein [Virgibacillus halodenitrificans]|uniref:TIGR04104 family putative zinc finger protein n=1 Tax=Virgibacillus halodenitrificans TaxID=1482 RepID=UPI003D318932